MCLANGLTDAFALEARPSSATYNPVTAAAWNAAARAEKANKKKDKEGSGGSSDEDGLGSTNEKARSDAEGKVLGAPAKTIEPGEISSFHNAVSYGGCFGTSKAPDNECLALQILSAEP